jgi:hypothetical protein
MEAAGKEKHLPCDFMGAQNLCAEHFMAEVHSWNALNMMVWLTY